MIALLAGVAAGYVILGAALNRLYLLLAPPPAELFPAEGTVIRSEAEGFTQRILKVHGDSIWVQLTLDPGAPGPPPHVHTRFAENFRVTAGSVTFELRRETKTVEEGGDLLVPPGVQHRVRNASDATAVVEGPTEPEFALPKMFGLFLAQAYGLFDETPAKGRLPHVILQMAFWSPLYDVWLPQPPIAVQRIAFALVRPLALMLGYRPWYARFTPRDSQPASASHLTASAP